MHVGASEWGSLLLLVLLLSDGAGSGPTCISLQSWHPPLTLNESVLVKPGAGQGTAEVLDMKESLR